MLFKFLVTVFLVMTFSRSGKFWSRFTPDSAFSRSGKFGKVRILGFRNIPVPSFCKVSVSCNRWLIDVFLKWYSFRMREELKWKKEISQKIFPFLGLGRRFLFTGLSARPLRGCLFLGGTCKARIRPVPGSVGHAPDRCGAGPFVIHAAWNAGNKEREKGGEGELGEMITRRHERFGQQGNIRFKWTQGLDSI